MINTQQKKNKVRDGRMMIGICLQYIYDNYKLTPIEHKILNIILRNSFGYRKQNAFINQKIFELNGETLKKYRDMLTEKRIIKWSKTRKYTIYEIIEPKKEISNFDLYKNTNVIHYKKKKKEKIEVDLGKW